MVNVLSEIADTKKTPTVEQPVSYDGFQLFFIPSDFW